MLTSEELHLQVEADMLYLPEHFAELVEASQPPVDFQPPHGWGLYAWFLKDGARLGVFPVGASGLVYIGRSNDLSRRDIKQHLADGGTSLSTLRRSLGAILKESLSLTAVPRRQNPRNAKDFTQYAFNAEGEKALTAWMFENLKIGAAIRDDPDFYEPLLIKHNRPLLNLTGWRNPDASTIRALRKRCSDEARAYASAAGR